MEGINIQHKELISPRGIKGDVRLFLSRVSTKGYPVLPSSMSGAGTSPFNDKDRGIFLSEMEAIERLANSISTSRCLVSDAESLGDLAADMDEFPTISKISEPASINNEFSSKKLLRWVQSIEIQSKSRKYIPLEFVCLYTNRLFNGEGITNPISTGMSVHDTYTLAILNGIYEVIERDAIALTWLLQYPGKRITNKPYGLDFNVFDNEFLGNTELYDVSTIDGIYTFCLKAKSYHNQNISTVLMFATHINPMEALKKLKKELISVIYSMVESSKFFPDIINQNYNDFVSVEQGGLYMAHQKNQDYFNFFNTAQEIVFDEKFNNIFENEGEELKYIKGLLKNRSIYVTDLTNRECRERGIKAVKVNIPSLQPISFVHRSRFLCHKRIKEYSIEKLGHYEFEKLNLMPLPFS